MHQAIDLKNGCSGGKRQIPDSIGIIGSSAIMMVAQLFLFICMGYVPKTFRLLSASISIIITSVDHRALIGCCKASASSGLNGDNYEKSDHNITWGYTQG